MASVKVKIQPEILKWALTQVNETQLGDKLLKNVMQWLDGSKLPTFAQVDALSKKAHIPLGYFFLSSPPKEEIKLTEYRTVDSASLSDPSRELIDTIHAMEDVQDWMIDYRKAGGYDPLPFVGSMKGIDDHIQIVNAILSYLGIDPNWQKNCRDITASFNYFRNALEEAGIIVMMNGIVGNNTHRPLNINEFRAFTLVNEWAPLIFINAADSCGAKLFSLLHEAAHIWVGIDSLYNDRYSGLNENKLETLCNAVAGELLVPNSLFLKEWSQYKESELNDRIKSLSKIFKCGISTIARKALDNHKISKTDYEEIINEAIEAFKTYKDNRGSGGNYYSTAASRLDKNFVRALNESIKAGKTSFTEAYRLTNTNKGTFPELLHHIGEY